jgi:hypothetical protein
MASAADGYNQVVITCKLYCAGNVGIVGASDNKFGALVHHAVMDFSCGIVIGVAGCNDPAPEMRDGLRGTVCFHFSWGLNNKHDYLSRAGIGRVS